MRIILMSSEYRCLYYTFNTPISDARSNFPCFERVAFDRVEYGQDEEDGSDPFVFEFSHKGAWTCLCCVARPAAPSKRTHMASECEELYGCPCKNCEGRDELKVAADDYPPCSPAWSNCAHFLTVVYDDQPVKTDPIAYDYY